MSFNSPLVYKYSDYVLVYPKFEKVKIYRLDGQIYDKMYKWGKFKFELCDNQVDFGKIFKKRR